PCPSLLPLDEQAEEANARRREDHVEDEHELQVVTELSKGGAREHIARRDDGRDEHRRQEGQENARQDEVAGSRAYRHGTEERAGSCDAHIGKQGDGDERPQVMTEVEAEQHGDDEDHDHLDRRDESQNTDRFAGKNGSSRERRDDETAKSTLLSLARP